jgi:putative flippase GtrA
MWFARMKLPAELLSRGFLVRTARFVLVGIAGTLIYAVCAYGMLFSNLSVLTAHIIAYGVSLLASYIGHKIFTFGIRGDNRRNLFRFVTATAVIALVQLGLVAGLEHARIDPKLTLLISTFYYPLASFLVHNLWTFRTHPRVTAGPQK